MKRHKGNLHLWLLMLSAEACLNMAPAYRKRKA